jgi:hypothetical protein
VPRSALVSNRHSKQSTHVGIISKTTHPPYKKRKISPGGAAEGRGTIVFKKVYAVTVGDVRNNMVEKKVFTNA